MNENEIKKNSLDFYSEKNMAGGSIAVLIKACKVNVSIFDRNVYIRKNIIRYILQFYICINITLKQIIVKYIRLSFKLISEK